MRIIIQAGHEGRTTGSTGAPNEREFNIDISNKVADEMRKRGVEVMRVNADPKQTEISGDWDLFLSVHYDADVYGKGGFFVDFPEPSTDGATEKSQAISRALADEYARTTGIINRPERSNKNTRYYYMWSSISSKTPCSLIECGVGMHVPDDHSILHFNRPLVVTGIVKGLCAALNVPFESKPIENNEIEQLKEENNRLKKELEDAKSANESLKSDYEAQLATCIEECQLSKKEMKKDIINFIENYE